MYFFRWQQSSFDLLCQWLILTGPYTFHKWSKIDPWYSTSLLQMPHKLLMASHISKFSLPLAYCLQNPPANGKQGPVAAEKCPKPCWPIRSKGKTAKYTPLTLLSISYLPEEYVYVNWKLEEPLKNLKTSYDSSLTRIYSVPLPSPFNKL